MLRNVYLKTRKIIALATPVNQLYTQKLSQCNILSMPFVFNFVQFHQIDVEICDSKSKKNNNVATSSSDLREHKLNE